MATEATCAGSKGLRFAASCSSWPLRRPQWSVRHAPRSERERYLTSRNFRLLSTIATQLDSSISGQLKTFGTVPSAADGKIENGIPTRIARAIPSCRAWRRWTQSAFRPRLTPRASTPLEQADSARPCSDHFRAWSATLDSKTQRAATERRTRQAGAPEPSISRSAACWHPVFAPKLRDGAFDALVLASTDGRRTARRGSECGAEGWRGPTSSSPQTGRS